MKYVMVIIYIAMGGDGELQRTEFTTEFPNRVACIEALEETETKLLSRVDARSLVVTCRPANWADEPVSMELVLEGDIFVAKD